jgi:hypothetical protein
VRNYCTYLGNNVLEVEIEETELLFIDTYHYYAQLKKELKLHAGKISRYIAFHDTFNMVRRVKVFQVRIQIIQCRDPLWTVLVVSERR